MLDILTVVAVGRHGELLVWKGGDYSMTLTIIIMRTMNSWTYWVTLLEMCGNLLAGH